MGIVRVTVKNNTLTPVQKDGCYELSPYKKKRSNPQNAYYWGVLIKYISEETGYTESKTHLKLCQKFLLIMDDGTPYAKRTTDLNTAEMEKYNEDVRRWASSFLNLYLPLPNEEL